MTRRGRHQGERGDGDGQEQRSSAVFHDREGGVEKVLSASRALDSTASFSRRGERPSFAKNFATPKQGRGSLHPENRGRAALKARGRQRGPSSSRRLAPPLPSCGLRRRRARLAQGASPLGAPPPRRFPIPGPRFQVPVSSRGIRRCRLIAAPRLGPKEARDGPVQRLLAEGSYAPLGRVPRPPRCGVTSRNSRRRPRSAFRIVSRRRPSPERATGL